MKDELNINGNSGIHSIPMNTWTVLGRGAYADGNLAIGYKAVANSQSTVIEVGKNTEIDFENKRVDIKQ